MISSSRSLIISAALALGLSLPACAYAGTGVTFSEINVAESKVGVAQTEASTSETTEAAPAEESKAKETTKDEAKAEDEKSDKDKSDDSASAKDDEKQSTTSEEPLSVDAELSDEEAEQLLGSLFGLFGIAGQTSSTSERTISVGGTAEVNVVPDKASFGVSVVTEAKTAKEAQTANAKSVTAITDALTELKVDEKSIQTTATSLYPEWDFEKDEEGAITGYVMTTRLEISNLDIDEVGGVIAALVDQGANSIDGPTYYASNYDEAYAEALAKAVKVAAPKAEAMAEAAGLKLGPIKSISEGWEDRSYALAESTAKAMDANKVDLDTGSFDLNPGEVTITASVQLVYAIA